MFVEELARWLNVRTPLSEADRQMLERYLADPDILMGHPSRFMSVPRYSPQVARTLSATGHRRAYEGEYPSVDITAIGDGWRRLRPVEQHLPPALPSIRTPHGDGWLQRSLDATATRRAVEDKAHALLMRHLTPEQQRYWIDAMEFYVIGEVSGHRYRIERKSQANVWCVDTQTRYCLQFKENAPLDDLYLAQKLLLETDEMEFIKVANNLTNSERNTAAVDWNMVSAGRLSEENQNAFINYGRALMGISLATPIRPETA